MNETTVSFNIEQFRNDANYLFRGVSMEKHCRQAGRLIPAGKNIEIVMFRNDCALGVEMYRDGTFERVPSENNTVRGHQLISGIHDGCFISTTENFKVAVRFATSKGTSDGVIYKIDTSKFSELGIVKKKFIDPRYPDEMEVSIRAGNGGEIPQSVIAEIIKVRAGDYTS